LAGQDFVPLSGGTMTGNLNTPSINSGGITGDNLIINGNFDFWQRGVSFSGQEYTADRWISFANDSVTRQSFSAVSEIPGAQFYLRKTSVQAGGYHAVQNTIENGGDDLSGKTVTLSFWARRTSASDYSMEVFTLLNNDQQLASTSITLTANWTKYIITWNIPVTNASNPHRYVRWNPGADGRNFDLAQVKLEIGSVATPFTRAGGDLQGELAKCQRYYYTLPYNYNAARLNPFTDFLIMNTADQTTWARGVVNFPVTMRTTPTLENPTAANYFLLSSTGVLSVTSISIDNMTNASMAVVNAYRTGMSTGTTYFLRFANNTTDYLRFSAEL
jgi:hypothetical protein